MPPMLPAPIMATYYTSYYEWGLYTGAHPKRTLLISIVTFL